MNLFRSEEHARKWVGQHTGLASEVLTLNQALAWVTFIGKDRPRLEYTHPRVLGTLGPFLSSIGVTGDFWKMKQV